MSRSKLRPMVEQPLPFPEAETTGATLARTHLAIVEAHLQVAVAAIEREMAEGPERPELFSAAAVERRKSLEAQRTKVQAVLLPEVAKIRRALLALLPTA